MTADIFIRTYHADLEWLKYCLRSIHKFVTGYRQIIICIPANQVHLLKPFNLTQEKVVPGIVGKNDYVLQQIDKLRAYQHTDADSILFVDSDVCFNAPVHVSEYFRDGKPIIFETPWELVGQAICWKAPTEQILGCSTETEKMRRLPFTFKRHTLQAIDNAYQVLGFASKSEMSEFNLMGSFAKIYEAPFYYFWNTVENPDLPDNKLRQGWSWGGLSDPIKTELEEILK